MTLWKFDAIYTCISVICCQEYHQWHRCIPWVKATSCLTQVQHDFLAMWYHWCWHHCHVMPMVSSTAPLHSLDQWQSKWSATKPYLVTDTISIRIGITWCQQCCQRHHCIPWFKTTELRYNMIFLVMWHNWCWNWYYMMLKTSSMASLHSFDQDDWNEEQYDYFGHVTK